MSNEPTEAPREKRALLPDMPSFHSSLHNYFPGLLTTFLGVVIVILVAALSESFPTKTLLFITNQDAITAGSILAGLAFLVAVHKAYRAHADDVTRLNQEQRQWRFRGTVPDKATVNSYLDRAEKSARSCIWWTYGGLSLTAISLSILIVAYSPKVGKPVSVLLAALVIWLIYSLFRAPA